MMPEIVPFSQKSTVFSQGKYVDIVEAGGFDTPHAHHQPLDLAGKDIAAGRFDGPMGLVMTPRPRPNYFDKITCFHQNPVDTIQISGMFWLSKQGNTDMNTNELTRLVALYNTAKAANARAIDHNTKATWLDCTRHPFAIGYCNQAEETRQQANERQAEWMAAIENLGGEDRIKIIMTAEGVAA